jgi:hypothetical protein
MVAAVWKRKPGPGVMVHSDQGRQFASDDWQSLEDGGANREGQILEQVNTHTTP